MFETLSDRLQGIARRLTGPGKLNPDNIRDSLREVRRALLEADVQVGVARDFVARVEARAVGEEVLRSLTPGHQVVGIVKDELGSLLGRTPVTLANSSHVPEVVLLAGLQGSGKTTVAGKLAKWLGGRGKRVLLASADLYRPAAIDQLEKLAPGAGAGLARRARAPRGVHARGFPRPVAADEEDGLARRDRRDAAGDEPAGTRADRAGRGEAQALRGDPAQHDAARAAAAAHDRRQPEAGNAAGTGTSVREVNRLLKDFDQARTLMKRMRHAPRGLSRLRGGRG